MGSRDYRRRENKKAKKEGQKTNTTIFVPQTSVEIIKKGKKEQRIDEE